MKNFIIILLIFTSNCVISQNTTNSKENDSLEINRILKKIDSLNYSELDYNKMKKYYAENKELNELISKKASDGDKNATDFLDLMTLPYDKAIDKVGENEIKAMIYTYYMTVGIKEKFDKLNSDFDSKLDSLKLQKEYFEKEIKKDKRIIDSLKNN